MASDFAVGERVVVRDEEWLVRSVRSSGGAARLEVVGTSELVRDQPAVFFDSLDTITSLDPRDGQLVFDESPGFRRSRLWLESVMRSSPVPISDTRIRVGHRGLLDRMDYQLRPAAQALENLRPRILIGDAVGLGKTLEIGILLSELIRRGRGERILVVTPRAVLEQFQRELWTRFSIPLVRLDSGGIQKVKQTLPSSRNPFSYFKRVIVSIDTLKNPAQYRHHLQAHRWDAVVIDECHNLINRNTLNNQLAQLLAEQTDALILASATPHNGDPKSFAELINLLDPTAIVDPSSYAAKDIEHLYVRRHRNSPDVRLDVAHNWKQRRDPEILAVAPTAAEAELLRELEDVWLHPKGESVVSGQGRQLFPWTLFKAALSSPAALRSSVANRLRNPSVPGTPEEPALRRLDELAAAAHREGPAKLAALTGLLKEIGVAKGSPTRVVVFSERIDTLHWLAEELAQRLKLGKDAVQTLHAKLPDDKVLGIVEAFGQEGSAIRVLLASDMASEGLNLHQACHHLVHYDLPWSFIRIQQRNGRIDRYGQLHEPRIIALALTDDDPDLPSDLRVVTKLLQKEHEANRALGDAGVLLDVHDPEIEEATVMRALREGRDLDEVVPEPTPAAINPFAALMAIGGTHEGQPAPETATARSLFEDSDNFLAEALADVAAEPGGAALDLHRDADADLVAFTPPKDLLLRFRDLPADYLAERGIAERLKLTGSARQAEDRLERARKDTDKAWPDVHFLGPLHPVLDWAADRAVGRFDRNEIPVLSGTVSEPVFLTQAVWSNDVGKPAIAHWGAVRGLPDAPTVGDLDDALTEAGIREDAANPGGDPAALTRLQPWVPQAIDAARTELEDRRTEFESALLDRVEHYRRHLTSWRQEALFAVEDLTTNRSKDAMRATVTATADATSELIDSLAATGAPFVRVVGVIVPKTGI